MTYGYMQKKKGMINKYLYTYIYIYILYYGYLLWVITNTRVTSVPNIIQTHWQSYHLTFILVFIYMDF